MATIKTALEIALERTQDVKSDKSGIVQFEAKQNGKKLANDFLDAKADLADALKKTPDSEKDSLKQGIFDVLISRIVLPASKEDKEKIEKAGKGLAEIIKNKKITEMFRQLSQIFDRYLEESAHYEMAIRQQYAPKLRAKEEELSRRLGREVRIDPLQDPEFIALYNQNMNALKGHYEAVADQAREEIIRMWND